MSASISPTRCPRRESAMARLTATVVFPTPPLPEPMATIFETPGKATGAGIACPWAIIAYSPIWFPSASRLAPGHFDSIEAALLAFSSRLRLSLSAAVRRLRQNAVNLPHPIGQCRRSRLQDDGRIDLVDMPVAHGFDRGPPRPRDNRIPVDLFSAPRSQDHVRISRDNLVRAYDAVLRLAMCKQLRFRHFGPKHFGKDRLAAGDLDQLLDPPDPADQRIVPLLEVNARSALEPPRRRGNLIEPGSQTLLERTALLRSSHQSRHRPDHVEDSADGPLVE